MTKRAALTEQAIVGQTWDSDLLERAMGAIPRDFPVDSDVPGGMPEYRQTLTMSLFYKFYTVVRGRLAKEVRRPHSGWGVCLCVQGIPRTHEKRHCSKEAH